jgi:hypothetical protein
MNIQGNNYLSTFPDGINTTKLNDLADSVEISLTNNTIDLIGDNILVNGGPLQPGGGGIVTNPLNSNLNIGNVYDIVNNSGLSLRGIDLRTANVGTGTNNQYLMGDSSLLQYSANSGNSNFYLYKSHINTPGAPPDPGFVVYNNNTQGMASIIYISHLTSDNIDIEIFFNNINQINDVYLQDRNESSNYIKYNITGAPTIVVGSYIQIPVQMIVASGTGAISFGVNHNILLSFFSNNIEVDSRLTSLETKTQYQTGLGGNITGFTGNLLVTSEMQSGTIRKTGGLTSQFLKANGDIDNNNYAISSGIQINSSVPYINSVGQVSSNISNLYVQLGQNTIQSAITAIGVGYNIQCSSGGSTENIILNKQNYTLCGANCPPFGQTTQITGNVTIGDVSVLSTRIRMKDIKIVGNLTFISSVNNELRTFIDNCDFSGTITLPTIAGSLEFYSITFTGCSFFGANPIVIPDQNTYRLTFSKCIFFGQTITNNLTLAHSTNLLFETCSGLLSLSLGNCIKVGNLITSSGVITQFSSNLSLAGSSSSFVKYDGSADSILYSYRKFSRIGTLATYNLSTVATNIIPTTNGSILFEANEAKIGDVYVLTMKGYYTVAVLGQVIKIKGNAFSSAFGFDNLIPFPSVVSGGTSYTYSITVTILTATTCMVYSELTTSVGNSTTTVIGGTSGGSQNCNITTSSTFTLTATSTASTGNTIIPYVIYLMKN